MGGKIFRDPVHGDMSFSPRILMLIDHPRLQRLRGISQNGLLNLVFPGMRHSRFEHSLGAAWLASEVLKVQRRFLKEWLSKGDDQAKNLEVPFVGRLDIDLNKSCFENLEGQDFENIFIAAALMHDIGHGPFSHLFEELNLLDKILDDPANHPAAVGDFLKHKATKGAKIEHEDISLLYAAQVLEDKKWKISDVRAICYLISKSYREFIENSQEKTNIIEKDLLNACRMMSIFISGLIDVDRLDYIRRDSLMAGVTYGNTDSSRIIAHTHALLLKTEKSAKATYIIRPKTIHSLDHFLVSLYELYTQVYFHRYNVLTSHEMKLLVRKIDEQNHLNDIKNISWHSNSSDSIFLNKLRSVAEDPIKLILTRNRSNKDSKRRAVSMLAKDSGSASKLSSNGYKRISVKPRPLIKDPAPVLVMEGNNIDPACSNTYTRWDDESLVMSRLRGHEFATEFWWNDPEFEASLLKFGNESLPRQNLKG